MSRRLVLEVLSDTLARHGLSGGISPRTIWDDLTSNGYLIVHIDDQEPADADHTAACIGQLRRDLTTLAKAYIEIGDTRPTMAELAEIVQRGHDVKPLAQALLDELAEHPDSTVDELHNAVRVAVDPPPTRLQVFTVLDRMRLEGTLTARAIGNTTVRVWRLGD